MKKSKKVIFIIFAIIVFIIAGCFLGLHIIKQQIVENKKIKEKDILGEWNYDDSLRGVVTINFKDNGILECHYSFPDKTYEHKYKLTYGSNSITYIEIECGDKTIPDTCFFNKFQNIDIIDNKLHFLNDNYEFKRIDKQEIEKREKLKENETKMFEAYLGNYDITYNVELVSQDFLLLDFLNEISVKNKCYWSYAGETPEKDIINSECINPVEFETLPHNFGGSYGVMHVYKIDNDSSILKTYFGTLSKVKSGYAAEGQDTLHSAICFKWQDSKTLVQTECVKQKTGYSSFDNSPNIDTKYEFKLTKKD